jgi:hypothetical protein
MYIGIPAAIPTVLAADTAALGAGETPAVPRKE